MFQKLSVRAVKQTAISLTVALVLIGGLAVSARAWSSRIRVDIANQSSYDIYGLFLSSSGDDLWGRDLLGSSVLATGTSVAVTAAPGRYDLKLVDEDGDTCTVMGLNLYSDTAWSITNRWLLSCEFH